MMKGTLLLVEDEVMIRKLASAVLGQAGVTILEATTTDQAIRLSKNHPGTIDLLVTDVVMTGMSGPQLHAKLCEDRPGLPALFMSGYTSPVLEEMGILRGETNLLMKPFSIGELLAATRPFLAERRPAEGMS